MNETRKKIIKLIEPFMDKTLSNGCWVKNFVRWHIHNYYVYRKIIASTMIIETWGTCNFSEWQEFNENLQDNEEWVKVLDASKWEYQRNNICYLFETEWGEVDFYNHNIKRTIKDFMKHETTLFQKLTWEILGHYDITAVLKYIRKETYWSFEMKKEDSECFILNIYVTEKHMEENHTNPITYELPLKPLHLFSDTEEQELLELLTKLKNG